ncbi:LacI family DNA-binding transcriptional regulator [Geminisphaera colitermitum]|uniref:LacI family DNA-binding transcriptional regulator n=1 Tax=Geminisphaera colitermitum TaxID=1148786 RepID=UPI000158C9F0|nr:LacI family DNA-binding transcriptional regulator [Geminisphaera colitermitum]
MQQKTLTITALAQHLNLSIATVSYALNGRGREMKIPETTIARVKAAAAELGYQPNFFAHNLRRQKTDTVGIVFADLEENWAHRVLRGMTEVFDEAGYTPLLGVHFWDRAREEREVMSFLQRRVDALICFPQPESRELYESLIAQKRKLLLLGDTLPGLAGANYVAWDSGEAARTVMRHLIASGRRRIAFVGPDHRTTMTLARYEAYCGCLAEAGLRVREDWVIWEKSGVVPTEAVMRLLQAGGGGGGRPDALFVVNDGLALPLLEELDKAGIQIPDQVAVASMGDLFLSRHRAIGLTSVHEPCEELGAELAKAALALIKKPRTKAVQVRIPGNTLERRRTAP